MQFKYSFFLTLVVFLLITSSRIYAQKQDRSDFTYFSTLSDKGGQPVEIEFRKGLQHYYPLMAIWVEDTTGKYEQTLYVAESIAKGVFQHAAFEDKKWKPGKKIIPAALPYWAHKQAEVSEDSLMMPTPEHPLPDAYTGATPTSSFVLKTYVAESVGPVFDILFEINQSWDWNEYWYNNKYPGNEEYMKSAQPAVVYKVRIDKRLGKQTYPMVPVGHSHPYGASGELLSDLQTLTTALDIADKITVRVK